MRQHHHNQRLHCILQLPGYLWHIYYHNSLRFADSLPESCRLFFDELSSPVHPMTNNKGHHTRFQHKGSMNKNPVSEEQDRICNTMLSFYFPYLCFLIEDQILYQTRETVI